MFKFAIKIPPLYNNVQPQEEFEVLIILQVKVYSGQY
jgi:hypothetical protein